MSEIYGIKGVEQKVDYTKKTTANPSASTNVDFSSYLTETKSMETIFKEASLKYNVPVNLIRAVAKAESDFRPNVVSKAGAQGVMQLMPKTAEYLGVKDPFDAEQNIMGGTKYLKELLDKYDGDTKLALAAYNAGMNNVKKYGGIPPFKETQNYVVKVMKYMNEGTSTDATYVAKTAPTPVNSTLITPTPINSTLVGNYLTGSGYSALTALDESLDEIFSEVDYLKLLELFLNEDKEEDEEKRPGSLM